MLLVSIRYNLILLYLVGKFQRGKLWVIMNQLGIKNQQGKYIELGYRLLFQKDSSIQLSKYLELYLCSKNCNNYQLGNLCSLRDSWRQD